MVRPCFLVIDRETSSSISTRKLVIETAKFNVLTAYSSAEAIQLLEKFPSLDGVVTDAGMEDMDCNELIRALKAISPSIPIVAVHTPRGASCSFADYTLDSFDPRELLGLLQTMFPEFTAGVEQRNEELEQGYFITGRSRHRSRLAPANLSETPDLPERTPTPRKP